MAKLSTYQTLAAISNADYFVFLKNGTDVAKAAFNTVLAAFGFVPGNSTTPSDFKDAVDVATTANVTLSGEQTIDGVLTSASRILVKNQTTASQNGIYVTAAGAWSRSTDADTSAEVTSGMQVLVQGGTLGTGVIYSLATPDPITLGTTSLTFTAVAISASTFVGKTVSGTTYTTILTDANKRLNCTNSAAKTVTIARQASVNHAVNTEIEIFNAGAGLLTISPDTGVTLNGATLVNAAIVIPQNVCVKVKKRANPNTWDVTGWTGLNALQVVTSSATVTPTFDNDAVKITAQAAGLTLANPTGTAKQMHGMAIRIKDNGTARSITYGSEYRAIGVTLPTTTVISKTLYLGLIYNSDDSKWDVVAVAQEA